MYGNRNRLVRKYKSILDFKKEGGSIGHLIKRKVTRNTSRQLLNGTPRKFWNHSARRINSLMTGRYFDYLEVGVAYGSTLQAVNARTKVGVDPNPLFDTNHLPKNVTIFAQDSDSFFECLKPEIEYDFIFLDGLHEAGQLYRDFINSLSRLRPNGWILIDDVIPSDSISAISSIEKSYLTRGVLASEGYPWHGDCYRILPKVFQMEFLDSFLVVYPDNPQLLVRVNNVQNCKQFLANSKFETVDFGDFEYERVFSSNLFRQMPLHIEDLLIKQLLLER